MTWQGDRRCGNEGYEVQRMRVMRVVEYISMGFVMFRVVCGGGNNDGVIMVFHFLLLFIYYHSSRHTYIPYKQIHPLFFDDDKDRHYHKILFPNDDFLQFHRYLHIECHRNVRGQGFHWAMNILVFDWFVKVGLRLGGKDSICEG